MNWNIHAIDIAFLKYRNNSTIHQIKLDDV